MAYRALRESRVSPETICCCQATVPPSRQVSRIARAEARDHAFVAATPGLKDNNDAGVPLLRAERGPELATPDAGAGPLPHAGEADQEQADVEERRPVGAGQRRG